METLREFRDQHLKTNAPGRAFVAFYEHVSPPIADVIVRHDWLRAIVRWILAPIGYSVAYPKTAAVVVWGRRGIRVVAPEAARAARSGGSARGVVIRRRS
jgi:hypothetical protein